MGWSLSQIRRKNTRNKCRAILKLLFFTSQDDPTLNPVSLSLSLSLSFPLSPRERSWLDLFTRPPKIWVVRKWDGREGWQSQETISATICLRGGKVKKGIYLNVLRLQNDRAKANHTGSHALLNHSKKVCPQWLFFSGKHLQAL